MKKIVAISYLFAMLNASYIGAADYYVAVGGTGDGSSWLNASGDLQATVTACPSNSTVWVSNGVYIINLVVGGGVIVRSKDTDPDTVLFDGNQAGRVISNQPSSWIMGITITNGYLPYLFLGNMGGGVYDGKLVRCKILNNTCHWNGGGQYGGYAYSCLYQSNSAVSADGQAAYGTILYNCTIGRNTDYNTSTRACVMWNCISYPGQDQETDTDDYYSDGNYAYGAGGFNGPGSISANPVYVSDEDYSLQSSSPCINAGTNIAWMTDVADARSKDIAGNSRIQSTKVDMGCYESPYGTPKKAYLWKK